MVRAGHQLPLEARRVAPARAGHQARRSPPDLEPVDAGIAGRLLRGDARRRGGRAARPAHGHGRHPAHRPERRRAVAGHRHRPRRAGSDEGGLEHSTSGPSSGWRRRRTRERRRHGRGRRRRRISRPTGKPRSTTGTDPTRDDALRGDLHERHDRRAQGRDAPPRHDPRDARGDRARSCRRASIGRSASCRHRTCSSRRPC